MSALYLFRDSLKAYFGDRSIIYAAGLAYYAVFAIATLLFVIGRQLLILFLERSDAISLYGTAGSVIALLVWVYYSAQIVLFGAEFTKLYADRFGQPIEPRKMAAFEDVVHEVTDKQ